MKKNLFFLFFTISICYAQENLICKIPVGDGDAKIAAFKDSADFLYIGEVVYTQK